MFTLKIETGNSAFDDGNAADEVARILRDVAYSLVSGTRTGVLHDVNGNLVGNFTLTGSK